MDYSLGGVSFQSIGIIPIKQNGSDLALSGHLDFPSRLGKCFHSWFGQNDVEPYTSASEIRFGGRDLFLRCAIRAADRLACLDILNAFYSRISTYTGLVTLVCDYGAFSVYIRDAVQGVYLDDNTIEVIITFREPNTTVNTTKINGSADYGIDGVSWSQLGSVLIGLEDRYNRSATKQIEVTQYQNEKFYIGKTSENKVNLRLLTRGDTYATLRTNIKNIEALFASPGERNLIIENDLQRRVFACEGFTVSDIRNNDGWYCFVDIPLIQSQRPQKLTYLGDNLGNYITDNLNNKILIKWQ